MSDFGEDAGSAGAITLSSSVNGEIESAGDKDWFSIALEAGKQYRVKVLGEGSGNGTLGDPVLSAIYTGSSSAIPGAFDDDSGIGLDSEYIFEPDANDTYYLEVSAFGNATGTYEITIEEVAGSTFNLSASNISLAEGNSGLTAFEFTVSRTGDLSVGASVAWSVAGWGANPATNSDFELGAFPGGVVNFAAEQSSQTITVNVAGDTDIENDEQFSVTLSNPSAGTNIGTGTKLGLILDDDTASDTGSAKLTLGGGSTINYEGQLGTTEFIFTVTRAGNTAISATADWSVQVVTNDDSVDGADFDGGVLPTGMVTFNPGETSKVISILVAGDTTAEPNEVFSVVLASPSINTVITSGTKLGTIIDDETDDFGQTTGDASQIGLGGSKSGNIENGLDEDWFGISLLAGNEYKIDLEGSSTNKGSLDDPLINGVYDSTGTLIPGTVKHDGGDGLNARLLFTPAADGTYYISAAPVTNFGGSYTLSVNLKANSLPTGTVAITGNAEEDQILAIDNTLTDADGLGDFNYQWSANGTPIEGATNTTYLLSQSDVGKAITVTVSYQDQGGADESVTSDPTIPVANVNDTPTGTVTIPENAVVGEELSASNTLADEDGLGPITYQWFADGHAIEGATGDKYTPAESDAGKLIRVDAFFTDGQGTEETVSSNQTSPVSFGELIEGTSEPDDLFGGNGNDTLLGYAGGDILRGLGGNDQINGGDGIDHAIFQSEYLDYSILNNVDQIDITGPSFDGNDTLIDVERLHFTDISLAFDLDGSAGNTAKLLGVLLGAIDPVYMGIGIGIFDNSGLSFEEVMSLGLDVVLTPNRSNADVVNLIYTNLVGQAPSQEELNGLTAQFLDSGAYTQVGLAVLAADHPFNTEGIGLDELIVNGVQYVPAG